ncbi:MAG: hypothetical protein HY796_10690 [Elusimicrobia bacterium]|nr:hypothetical protein [Elusimicrobiota bacterium]
MTILKQLSKLSLAAVSLSLFSASGAKAAELSFDGMDRGAGLAAAMQELKDRAATGDDSRAPVPSTTTQSNELTNFFDHLKDGALDSLCKKAEIKLNKDFKLVEVIGIDGGLKRRLKAFPDKRLALLDEINLKLSVSFGTEVLQVPNVGSLNIGISGGVEGKSVVVRPLDSTRYCKELDTLIKLYEVKTVLPVTAKRINKMEKGEIWKLPVTVHYSISAGIGTMISEVVNVSIGAGYTRAKKPSVSLYKMDENNLRLRLRLDYVKVKSVGVSANTVEVPVGDIGLISGENLIATTVNRELAKEINKMIAFKLAYSHAMTSGQKLLLEFYLDPNNAEQVDRLAEFLQGDFNTIRKFIAMGLKFNTFSEEASGQAGVGEIEELADQAGSELNATSTFAGSDHYNGNSNNFNINIPVIHNHQNSWASSYHRYQSLNNDGATIHVRQRTRVSNGDTINIPLIGTVVKYNSQQHIYAVNKEAAGGEVSRPVLLYQKYEGFLRQGDSTARGMIDDANNVLKYAGRQGNGVDMSNTLPSAAIFPPLPPQEYTNQNNDYMQSDPVKTYKAAVMSFKLVFAQTAVQDIIFAPAQLIMKSFMNVMRETEAAIIDKVMDLFTINEKGKVDYDYKAVIKRLDVSPFPDNNNNGQPTPLDIVRNLAYAATKFIERIVSVRDESDLKAQSERLAKVASSGEMKYEDFLKVVIQMVDVKDISSEIYIHTDKRVKDEEDVTQTYSMFNNRDNGFDSTIADVTQMRERFNDPGDLTD